MPSRIFQITLRGMGRISLPNGGEWEILLGRIFYWVVGIWGGVIPTILIFFKAKNQHSANIEHQLKSKLAWLVCKKSMKLNLKMVQDQQLQPKNKVLFALLLKNCYSVGAMKLWWGESTGGEFWLVRRTSLHHPIGSGFILKIILPCVVGFKCIAW